MSEPPAAGDRVGERHRLAMDQERLIFQRCSRCEHAWLPPRPECPHCLHDGFHWEQAQGRGIVVSWVVYRRAYHPSMSDRVPYNVALVQLAEGPRLLSNVVGLAAPEDVTDGMEVRAVFAREGGVPLVRFVAA
jgi:uncharacterized OB-fold protein